MDERRFDLLARALSGEGSRRGVLQVVAALPVLAWLTMAPETEAKSCAKRCRRKDQKKARRRCRKRCQKKHQPPPPACQTNADCPPGEVCEDGQCLPEPDQCATAADCDACEACDDGACVSTCQPGAICRNGACCQPRTACPDGRDCGVMDDGCGGLLRCGSDTCADGYLCVGNRCFCPAGYAVCQGKCCEVDAVCADGNGPCCTPSCNGKACGADDDCGGVCQTGSCEACEFCLDGACQQEFPGTPCGGANAETICLFDGECGVITCDAGEACPGDCRCSPTNSNLCYEGAVRGCPIAEPCVDFACPPRFECYLCPGGDTRCLPLCSG